MKSAPGCLLFALLFAIVGRAADPTPILTTADVQSVVKSAAASVNSSAMVIAVTDRLGNILAVYRKPAAPALAPGNFGVMVDTNELAVALARTGAFFSNSQAPLSSRTVRFISGTHFPPGVSFVDNGALYGIENTNRGCPLNVSVASRQSLPLRFAGARQPVVDRTTVERAIVGQSSVDRAIVSRAVFAPGQAIPPATLIDGVTPGLGPITGKADLNDSDQDAVNPGGVPLFKSGVLVGGVGVAGVTADIAEFAAISGAKGAGFGAAPADPGVVFINGIALPFVNQTTQPNGTSPGSFDASTGTFIIGPIGSPGTAPEGDLIAAQAGPKGGLSQAEVQSIVDAAVDAANQTRAVIRLPIGSRARMVIAVADLDGTLLALHRMPDATVFSIDVAVAKSRNVIYFTSSLPPVPAGDAVTNRTIGFGAQPFFPPGLDYTSPGPFFDLYKFDVAHPCTQGAQAPNPNQNGIVFFPGSLPLYKDGKLVGGLGVSGDGVDQDDYVTSQGGINFQAPASIRADQVIVNGVRLPYLKFPRNPTN